MREKLSDTNYLEDNQKIVAQQPGTIEQTSGLKTNSLSFFEVLGESVANIAPTATPAITIPVVFALAGNGTWISYLIATIACVLLAKQVNVFSRRYATSGSLYTYVTDGLGNRVGFMSGASILFAYITTAVAVLAGFAIYAHNLLAYFNIALPYPVLMAFGTATAWFMAQKGVELSTKTMMTMEFLSVSIISILGIVLLFSHHFSINPHNIAFTNVSFGHVASGLGLAFFSFVGFEGAASMGKEAKEPLKNIPRAVISSPLAVGIFFIIMSLIMMMGFEGTGHSLGESTSPLAFLATSNHVTFLGYCITLGAVISFWSSTVGVITAGSRIMMKMSHEGYLGKPFAFVNEKKKTPTISIGILGALIGIFGIAFALMTTIENTYEWFGTIAVWGFLIAYLLVTISAPVFLHKHDSLKFRNVISATVTGILLMIPIIGSIYPQPEGPAKFFPYIFGGWLLIAFIYREIRDSQLTAIKPTVTDED
ncbi:APC family permease [Lentilactobacillus farraginis]|uniref:Amino acid permease-associated region n=2 Tax=Lentilactobacillus farraginis DSM 18382 = JCM 14108 TaxID=1423743 RepID=A0A0R1W4Z7_9LACO|nr:APC family permease [Lentilactobacillus farraginis]KRM12880.1 amino acid permease-associated region [Lentilactobacillus farraginis DSM 18382 = JCM 14108]